MVEGLIGRKDEVEGREGVALALGGRWQRKLLLARVALGFLFGGVHGGGRPDWKKR